MLEGICVCFRVFFFFLSITIYHFKSWSDGFWVLGGIVVPTVSFRVPVLCPSRLVSPVSELHVSSPMVVGPRSWQCSPTVAVEVLTSVRSQGSQSVCESRALLVLPSPLPWAQLPSFPCVSSVLI